MIRQKINEFSGPIAIALSGGIDSMVAAVLLCKAGNEVIGIHFETGLERNITTTPFDINNTTSHRLKEITSTLNIPLVIINLSDAFKTNVILPFISEYKDGRTPNPCMICNREIKFGALLEKAKTLGACLLATGHYARVYKNATIEETRLLRGIDKNKDQSYFLAMLSHKQLENAFFPLGGYTKNEVVSLAKELGINSICGTESQDVCFAQGHKYSDFIAGHLGEQDTPGTIVDIAGNPIGTHQGIIHYTIGQRRGIGIPGRCPNYVIKIDKKKNLIVVGTKSLLYTDTCLIKDINWLVPPHDQKIRADIRLRFKHKEVPATITCLDVKTAVIHFDQPQAAVTPGQGGVFFQGETVLGGGWISA
ncbi:MAG: tRNA 2-thiouridine(34) synthase MnmA [Pseudomonadota bacterium]